MITIHLIIRNIRQSDGYFRPKLSLNLPKIAIRLALNTNHPSKVVNSY